MIDALNHVLFNFGQDAVTPAELLGFITGLATVYLVVKEKVANFPVGIVNNLFFFVLFINAALYADAWLQIVYALLGVLGWAAWLTAGPNRTRLDIGKASISQLAWVIAGVVAATFILTPILREAHGAYPHWDALTTSLSLGAQALLNFKKVQNWYFWIAADLIYIPLYYAKDLYLTSIVYVCFLALCIVGLKQWREHHNAKLAYEAGPVV